MNDIKKQTQLMNYEHRYSMYVPKMITGSRWATLEEMKTSLKKIDLSKEDALSSGIPIFREETHVYVDDLDNHTLILGSTGSKKTRLFCMPTINLLGHAGESMIISDPKGELLEKNSGYLLSKRYKIGVLNFREPAKSNLMWNPLFVPYMYYKDNKFDKATEMVTDFVHTLKGQVRSERDPYWEITASNYIVGIILLLFELAKDINEVNMKSVVLLASYAHDTNELELSSLAKFVKKLPRHGLAAIKMLSTLLNADNTRKSILGTVDTMLSPFMNSLSLTSLLSKTNFDIKALSKEKHAIFLIIPDEKTTLHFLASAFIKQSYELMIDAASQEKNHTLSKRVNFVLDEFANMPRITDMPAMITAARSRNMRFFLVVQSEQQLFNIYKEEAQTIKGNCTNWIFLTSRERNLLEEIQALCGKRNAFDKEEPLISISQLQMFDKMRGQALILQARNYPFMSYLPDIDLYPEFKGFEPILLTQQTFEPIQFFDFDLFYQGFEKGHYLLTDYFKHEQKTNLPKNNKEKYDFLKRS
ncbi:MAG: type IV secretory system conjugative DNA transfer family protein [Acholeplasma sp.]|nr:type IV secretory system conjugative DNA transfer family protein [Acholeplasma sp.]